MKFARKNKNYVIFSMEDERWELFVILLICDSFINQFNRLN
jgi:hypothetical protein